jgi:hypothetical protein
MAVETGYRSPDRTEVMKSRGATCEIAPKRLNQEVPGFA